MRNRKLITPLEKLTGLQEDAVSYWASRPGPLGDKARRVRADVELLEQEFTKQLTKYLEPVESCPIEEDDTSYTPAPTQMPEWKKIYRTVRDFWKAGREV